MADRLLLKNPAPTPLPHIRFGLNGYGFAADGSLRSHGLGVGVATSNGGINYEVVRLYGMSTVSVRLKTATNGGTLDFFAVGPDFNPDQAKDNAVYGSLVGTIYTTGAPTQVAITAGTEAIITFTGKGEGFGIIKFTGTVGAGVITYCDVSYFHQSL